jgi:threonine dehydrogenase-like Zn-dependent dehydrogenase
MPRACRPSDGCLPVLANRARRAARTGFGRAAAGADIPAVLELIAAGGFDPSRVTDRILPFAEASTALLEPHTKLVFTP